MTTPTPVPEPALTARELYRIQRHSRQNRIFTIIISAMTILVLLSLLVLKGIIPIPFGNTFNAKQHFAAPGEIPCPPADSRPVDPATVKVQILNTTSRQGIAGEATQMLTTAGYTPLEPSNSTPEYAGKVEITTGINGVAAAYTVARFFPGSHVVLSTATDASVIVELGTFYDGALSADEITRLMESNEPLVGTENCLPLSEDDLAETQSAQSGS